MIIPEQDQESSDFDWFALDQDGFIGHFTTAGFKRLPTSVAQSKENLQTLATYFQHSLAFRGGHLVDGTLSLRIPNPSERGDRYLRSFSEMADRGLYSYDIAAHLRKGIEYFRVAIPLNPLRVEDAPDEIRFILERTVLKDVRFNLANSISYELTVSS